MTLEKAMKDVPFTGNWGIYNIGFDNGDETQFDVRTREELTECWNEFCKENGYETNGVDYVEKDESHIYFENPCAWTDEDVKTLQNVYEGIETTEDITDLYKSCVMYKVADKGDYHAAYKDYAEDTDNPVDFYTFLHELQKGHGNSGIIDISRLVELSNGIWYDRDYCG